MNNNNFDKFGLSNFKAFSELQSFEIAPITLIYGQNSGGKSTLLSSLMCVAQSLDEIDKGFFKTNGFLYDAGTFDTIKNFNSFNEEHIIIELQSKVPNKENKLSDAIYLKSLESLLYPKFKLFISNNQENRSKLIIEKIELHYGENFSNLKLIFNSSDIPIIKETQRGYLRFRSTRIEFENSKVFTLDENSIKDLNEISYKALNNISSEIKNSIEKIDNQKLCTDGILILKPMPGRYPNNFYRTENSFTSNGLIKIAGILAGGWISTKSKGIKFTKFNDRNIELLDLIQKYVVDISKKNFEFYENKNYIPSFFIDSSAEGSKLINDVEHINIRYLQNIGTEFSKSKLNQLNTTKEEFFEKSLSLISEKKQLENQDIKKITLSHEKLIRLINDSKKCLIDIKEKIDLLDIKNMKLDNLKKLQTKDLQEKIYKFNETIENHEKLNLNLYFNTSFQGSRKEKDGRQIYEFNRDKLEIIDYLKDKSNELYIDFNSFIDNLEILKSELVNNKDILKKTSEYDLNGEVYNLLDILESCEDFLDLILLNTYELDKSRRLQNKIATQKEKIIIDNKPLFYELMCFLFEFQVERRRALNYRVGINKNKDFLYPKRNLFLDPFFSKTFIPYKLSNKIIHLRAFREGAKRAYSIDDINAKNENDIAFLITILDKEKNTFFVERLNEDLKKLEIGETIYAKPSIDPKYDFKSIIIKQSNQKEVNIVDTGYGISQMLPIIIHANTSENNTLIIQQPETHIHPRLQAELATILARTCNENLIHNFNFIDPNRRGNKNFIIETHSETILLRLLREIRNKKFNKDDLKVYYINKTQDGSEIMEMEITKEGELISQWPDGFFSTELDEMMD